MDENLKKFLIDVMSLSEDVVAICDQLGAMRSILAFSNLDRMRAHIVKDVNFEKLSVIDADQILWVSHSKSATQKVLTVSFSISCPNMCDMKKSCHRAALTN